MEIRINPKGEVRVMSPRFVALNEIDKFVGQKAQWVFRKIEQMQKEVFSHPQRHLQEGDQVFFLGQEYTLMAQKGDERPSCMIADHDRKILFFSNHDQGQDWSIALKDQLMRWYRHEAKTRIEERTLYHAHALGIKFKKVIIKKHKTIWGSFSQKTGVLNINWKIIMAPLDVMDYLIVHELCHAKVANHSRQFWFEVKQILPDYQKCQRWLKGHARELNRFEGF
ncbi:MAG: SprT family zinc-dependent metalloprotease [Candidatus Omnitrophota bacterium]